MSGSKAFREPSVRWILDRFKINKWEFWRKTVSFLPFCFGRKLPFPREFLLSSHAVIGELPGELYLSELSSLSSLFSIFQTTYLFISPFSAQCQLPISICLVKMDLTKVNSLATHPPSFAFLREQEDNRINIFLDISNINYFLSLDKEATAVSFCKAKQKYPAFIIFLITEFRTTLMERWENCTERQFSLSYTHARAHVHTRSGVWWGIKRCSH